MAMEEGKYVDAVGTGLDGLIQALSTLKKRDGIEHLMVEGGPQLAKAFLEGKLVDRAIVVRAETVTFSEPVPSGISGSDFTAAGLERVSVDTSGEDTVECWTRPDLPWPGPSWPRTVCC